MPELFSRMDDANWLTPSIADILAQGSGSSQDNSIRDVIQTLQEELNQAGTPGRVVNVRNYTSYTLFVTKPETIGRLGNRRTIRPEEIEKTITTLNESHDDWLLGYSPVVPNEDADNVGIYICTNSNVPLNLRRILVRNSFRKYPSSLVVPIGIDIEQSMALRDLKKDKHIILISEDAEHQHLIRGMLLTLLLLNTPGELRLAIAGTNIDPYKMFIGSPHALGRLLTKPASAEKLFDGLSKEIKRREQLMQNNNFSSFDDYNAQLNENSFNILPRVLVMLDIVGSDEWLSNNQWMTSIQPILERGAEVGIHAMISSSYEAASFARDLLEITPRPIIMKSAQAKLVQPLENFHDSLLQFIHAFSIEDKYNARPIEMYAVGTSEIRQAVEYWRANAAQRTKESVAYISGKTGVTDMLTSYSKESDTISPPVPDVPPIETIQRATAALAQVTDSDNNEEDNTISNTVLGEVLDRKASLPKESTMSAIQTQQKFDDVILEQSIALAAYLGWLSIGALHDILHLSEEDAQNILNILGDKGIIEKEGSVPRFIRVAQTPS